jgi:hypothetical protein
LTSSVEIVRWASWVITDLYVRCRFGWAMLVAPVPY